jgi:hypothetical protein
VERKEKQKLSVPNNPTRIEINLGYKSTWNFQSVNVNIGITDNRRNDESMDQAVDRIYNYVQTKLMEKMEITKKEVEAIYVKRGKKN